MLGSAPEAEEPEPAVSAGTAATSSETESLKVPTATSSDVYTVNIKLLDDDTGEDADSVSITVSNEAPLIQNLAATDVDENGSTTLTGD